jgi:hypothetical protein
MTSGNTGTSLEDLLYHVLCEVIDYHEDKSGATRTTNIVGTYTSLPAAKAAALSCLKTLGYNPSEFSDYEENTDVKTWKHGDGVIVYAKAPAGQEFKVRLDTTPNGHGFKVNKEGMVTDRLNYVIQTRIDYNDDRIGGIQTTEIEGVYHVRKEAYEAAYKALLDDAEGITKESFARYDERDLQMDDWPYEEEVLVHAVSTSGENFLVAVKEQLNSFKA